mgnify:CR=1 FL=1
MRLLPLLALAASLAAPALATALEPAQVDQYFRHVHEREGVVAAPVASDAEFLRRLSLDVRGVIPTVEETIAFLSDDAPDKRARVIDEFLASPERGAHWAEYWDTLLVGALEQPANPQAQRAIKQPWKEWVAKQVNANKPYDLFVREIVTAEGDSHDDPQVLPLARWRDAPESMAGSVSRVFLGVQIQCAQCHDHKTNPELTQDKFWEFASFFSPTRVSFIPPKRGNGDGMMSMQDLVPLLVVTDVGAPPRTEIPDVTPKRFVSPAYLNGVRPSLPDPRKGRNPREMRAMQASLRELREQFEQTRDPALLGEARRLAAGFSDHRREAAMDLMLQHDGDLLAANLVNRLWARLTGFGFLEPVDEWGMGIEPEHPELLRALVDEFIASGHDLRHIERIILNSEAYQRSSRPVEGGSDDPRLLAQGMVRPLSATQLLQSLAAVTDLEAAARSRVRNSRQFERLMADYHSRFVFNFGSDELEWVSTFQSSIPQALYLLNDPTINEAVKFREDGPLGRIAQTTDDPRDAVRYLYLMVLSREPDAGELAWLTGELMAARGRSEKEAAALLEDAAWALLASTEFMTNH